MSKFQVLVVLGLGILIFLVLGFGFAFAVNFPTSAKIESVSTKMACSNWLSDTSFRSEKVIAAMNKASVIIQSGFFLKRERDLLLTYADELKALANAQQDSSPPSSLWTVNRDLVWAHSTASTSIRMILKSFGSEGLDEYTSAIESEQSTMGILHNYECQ